MTLVIFVTVIITALYVTLFQFHVFSTPFFSSFLLIECALKQFLWWNGLMRKGNEESSLRTLLEAFWHEIQQYSSSRAFALRQRLEKSIQLSTIFKGECLPFSQELSPWCLSGQEMQYFKSQQPLYQKPLCGSSVGWCVGCVRKRRGGESSAVIRTSLSRAAMRTPLVVVGVVGTQFSVNLVRNFNS